MRVQLSDLVQQRVNYDIDTLEVHRRDNDVEVLESSHHPYDPGSTPSHSSYLDIRIYSHAYLNHSGME